MMQSMSTRKESEALTVNAKYDQEDKTWTWSETEQASPDEVWERGAVQLREEQSRRLTIYW
jgi:hypothetical protein